MSVTKLHVKPGSSNAWQSIASAIEILCKGIKVNIYNGRETLFWRDTWLGNTPLISVALREISMVGSFKGVSDYWELSVS